MGDTGCPEQDRHGWWHWVPGAGSSWVALGAWNRIVMGGSGCPVQVPVAGPQQGGSSPALWTLSHCVPRHISQELVYKWSSWDMNLALPTWDAGITAHAFNTFFHSAGPVVVLNLPSWEGSKIRG